MKPWRLHIPTDDAVIERAREDSRSITNPFVAGEFGL